MQRVGDPGVCRGHVRHVDHGEGEALPVQWPAQGQRVVAELAGNVVDHPRVGGRGGRQHRCRRRQPGQHLPDPPVVRPKVVPPVGNAVRLVHHQHAKAGCQIRQHPGSEPCRVQPLRRDQQHVGAVGGDLRLDRGPLVEVGRIQCHRVNAGALGRADLVSHQGQQRRDDQGRSITLRATQRRRDPVDRRLAPPGPLHHHAATMVSDQRRDRRRLIVPQQRLRPGQRPQLGLRPFSQLSTDSHTLILSTQPVHPRYWSPPPTLSPPTPRGPVISNHNRPTSTDPTR